MRTVLLTLGLTFLLPSTLWAQSFTERATQAYLQTDKNFDIDCAYSLNDSPKLIVPNGETIKSENQLSREFVIENNGRKIPMTFTLNRVRKNFEYKVVFDGRYISSGKQTKRDFFIAPVNDRDFANDYETSQISCSINLAYAKPVVLKDGNYHINVHPHRNYDWQSRLKDKVETYLNDKKYQSIILLETGNKRGEIINLNNFFDGFDPQLPFTDVDSELVNVPMETKLVVSPAGNSSYDIQAIHDLDVVITGGNHNYCIWNTTRHLIENYMNSNSEAKLSIHYDQQAIIAQASGIEGLVINFNSRSVNRSNLLADLLAGPDSHQSYHFSYFVYFQGYLARQFAGMYKTYKFTYHAAGFDKEVILEGQGTRNLEVSLDYR